MVTKDPAHLPSSGWKTLRRRIRRRWKHKPGWFPWLLALPTRCFIRLCALLPFSWVSRGCYWAAHVIWLSPSRRAYGRYQIGLALPELSSRERDSLLRKSCAELGRSVAEAAVLARKIKFEDLDSYAQWDEGATELLDELRRTGGIVVQAHLGAVEGVPASLCFAGLELAVPYRLPTNYYLAEDLKNTRQRFGIHMVARQGAIKKTLRFLKDKKVVIFACDQNAHHAPIFVPWFGVTAATERAPVALLLKTGVPLVVATAIRLGHRQPPYWRLMVSKIRDSAPPEEATMDRIRYWQLQLHEELEARIRAHPSQYLWIHNRYRTRPSKFEATASVQDSKS